MSDLSQSSSVGNVRRVHVVRELKIHGARVSPHSLSSDNVQIRNDNGTLWVAIRTENDEATAFFASAEDFLAFASHVTAIRHEIDR